MTENKNIKNNKYQLLIANVFLARCQNSDLSNVILNIFGIITYCYPSQETFYVYVALYYLVHSLDKQKHWLSNP